jgi:ADP-ribosylation factor-like protein 2
LLVFANKTDVNGCMDAAEIKEVCCPMTVDTRKVANGTSFKGLQLDKIRTHKWHIIRCSAITGVNLREGLAWVVQDAKERLFLY